MVRRGERTRLEERVEIKERAEAGQTDAEIAETLGRSVWTVRKWRRKGEREGREGLVSRLGRPTTGALGTFPLEMREVIRQMRKTHPGWGALSLRIELEKDERFEGFQLPSRPRIAALLKQEKLTRPYERHSELPQAPAQVPRQAHQQREMDAKGTMKVPSLGSVTLINIGDPFTRLKIDCFPCLGRSKLNTLDYQLVLRRAFLRYGLPQRFDLDHDSVFYDNTCPSPYPTRLHLWLIALHIEVRFGRKGCPTDHAFIERTHQTITQQAIVGQDFADESALQCTLDERLDFLNLHFPCSTLGDQPPLVVFPEAHHSGRPYRPEWEVSLMDLQRVYDYLGQGRWFRRSTPFGQFNLGGYYYGAGKHFKEQSLEITFDSVSHNFRILSENGLRETYIPAQGLSKTDLMGELGPLVALPAYQLALPFSPSAWRQASLAADLAGTSFRDFEAVRLYKT